MASASGGGSDSSEMNCYSQEKSTIIEFIRLALSMGTSSFSLMDVISRVGISNRAFITSTIISYEIIGLLELDNVKDIRTIKLTNKGIEQFTEVIDRDTGDPRLEVYYYGPNQEEGILVTRENFNKIKGRLPSVFTIHGLGGSIDDPVNVDIKRAYDSLPTKRHTFRAVWNQGLFRYSYEEARNMIPLAGLQLSKIIRELQQARKLDLYNIFVYGHSLGGLVGSEGLKLLAHHAPVGSLMCLDCPHLFVQEYAAVVQNAAHRVEAIHSSALLGNTATLGHADYFFDKHETIRALSPISNHSAPIDIVCETIVDSKRYLVQRIDDGNVINGAVGGEWIYNKNDFGVFRIPNQLAYQN